MKELFRKKSSDFDMIQDGMKKIQDFESRKTELEQELRDVSPMSSNGCDPVSGC